jgi:hypothetical protein
MALKIINGINSKFGLTSFNGDSIDRFIFNNENFNLSDGLEERIALWAFPFESQVERMFGTERVFDLRDLPKSPYCSTPLLNHTEIELSSFIVALEKLSLHAIRLFPKLDPINLYLIQREFLLSVGSNLQSDLDISDIVSYRRPLIVDLVSTSKEKIKTINLLLKTSKFFRLPGSSFMVDAESTFVKHENENDSEYCEISKIKLIDIVCSEVKHYIAVNNVFIDMLSTKPSEDESEYLLNFLEDFKNVNRNLMVKKIKDDSNGPLKIGFFLRDPTK